MYSMPDPALEMLHQIDQQASGEIALAEEVTNPATRDRHVVNSLIEEAITSSQLEGAHTTRRVAKDMLRTGRAARSKDEQMIINNYRAMLTLRSWKSQLNERLAINLRPRMYVAGRAIPAPAARGALGARLTSRRWPPPPAPL